MDTYSSMILAEKIASELGEKIYILPPIWYGISPHHMNFPGTITISSETLLNLVLDIAKSLKRHGIQRLVIINGHGGNTATLSLAIRKIRDEIGLKVVLLNPWELASDKIQEILETKIWGHACEFETSVALVAIPDKVRTNKIKKPNIKVPKTPYTAIWERTHVISPWNTDDFTDTGSIGDPTKATKEKGEKLFKVMLERSLEFIKSFIEG